jgi:hypothetical protein
MADNRRPRRRRPFRRRGRGAERAVVERPARVIVGGVRVERGVIVEAVRPLISSAGERRGGEVVGGPGSAVRIEEDKEDRAGACDGRKGVVQIRGRGNRRDEGCLGVLKASGW